MEKRCANCQSSPAQPSPAQRPAVSLRARRGPASPAAPRRALAQSRPCVWPLQSLLASTLVPRPLTGSLAAAPAPSARKVVRRGSPHGPRASPRPGLLRPQLATGRRCEQHRGRNSQIGAVG